MTRKGQMRESVVSAPSNIALIKYMGKIDGSREATEVISLCGGESWSCRNVPSNLSFSLSLDRLRSYVALFPLKEFSGFASQEDQWMSWLEWDESDEEVKTWISKQNLFHLELKPQGKKKFLDHLGFLKKVWGVDGSFLVLSGNNFPSDAGIASSASSFAALTRAAAQEFQKLKPHSLGTDPQFLSLLSQQGSGSSCRSFFEPWAQWRSYGARPLDFPWKNLIHFVVVPDVEAKEVSSSEAHRRVISSLNFSGRQQRVESRWEKMQQALRSIDAWSLMKDLIQEEFEDMHNLFETSMPAFSYRNHDSLWILEKAEEVWRTTKDGPWITMDAGSSVHLIWRKDQELEARTLSQELAKTYRVWGLP